MAYPKGRSAPKSSTAPGSIAEKPPAAKRSNTTSRDSHGSVTVVRTVSETPAMGEWRQYDVTSTGEKVVRLETAPQWQEDAGDSVERYVYPPLLSEEIYVGCIW